MEKYDFFTNGGLKLPIGYRFCPTDEEVLLHYLKKKVHAMPLPASVIPEFDVFQTDPWALPGDVKEKRYFFCNRKRDIVNNKICKRVSGSGFWKPIGKDRLIVASELNNQAVGVRKTLVFCGGKRLLQDSKTRWCMHEYHFVHSGPIPNSVQQISQIQMKDYYWVVCGVFQKKRSQPKRHNNNKRKQMMIMEGSSTPSLSCSSGITEASSNGGDLEDDQEESSANISYSSNYCTREPN